MKYWMISEPVDGDCSEPVYHIYSESAILALYYDYWADRMRKVKKHREISTENCIQDWLAINWATPVTPRTLEEMFINDSL